MTSNTTVKFYPLTFVPDTPDVIVGRTATDSYASFPKDGAELLKKMQVGSSPQAAAAWYQECYGEPIDINDFLETLKDLGFVREGSEEDAALLLPKTVSWQWLGRAIFSPVAWIIYVLIFWYCAYLMIRFPYLRLSYHEVFFSPYFTVIELSLFLGQFPGILFHELYHMLAGQRLGISSRLSVGRRLYFLVFETHLTGLWSVPRKARYLPFLAGMLADLILISLLTIVASLTYIPAQPYSFPGFCLGLAFSTILRFIWQFYFYLQTDIYYVIANALRCVDLQQTTRRYLLNRFFRLIGRTNKMEDEELWAPRDRQIAPWYSPIFLAGYLFSILTALFVGLPVTVSFFTGVFRHLLTQSALSPDFWDSCIFLALNALQLAVVILVYLRERQQTKRQSSRTSSAVKPEILPLSTVEREVG